MRGREIPDRCLGCGAGLPESALSAEGLCEECAGEAELENFSDLDDEEAEA
jgi:hypothetical protein